MNAVKALVNDRGVWISIDISLIAKGNPLSPDRIGAFERVSACEDDIYQRSVFTDGKTRRLGVGTEREDSKSEWVETT